MSVIDMAGLKFGRLTVIERNGSYVPPNGNSKAKWYCLCECGNKVDAIGNDLRTGRTKSCGCLQKENAYKAQNARRKHFGCTYCGSDKHYAKGYCRNCYNKAKKGTLE